jgi:hypothetical protein
MHAYGRVQYAGIEAFDFHPLIIDRCLGLVSIISSFWQVHLRLQAISHSKNTYRIVASIVP